MLAALGAVVWKLTHKAEPPPLRVVALIDGPYSKQDCTGLVSAWKRQNGNRSLDRARTIELNCLRSLAHVKAGLREQLRQFRIRRRLTPKQVAAYHRAFDDG